MDQPFDQPFDLPDMKVLVKDLEWGGLSDSQRRERLEQLGELTLRTNLVDKYERLLKAYQKETK